MNIKDVEERTGISRGNVRFYEDKELISPKRRDNGYRAYSEENVRMLNWIKLLRRLGIKVETIRKIQQGKVTFLSAIEQRIEEIKVELKELEKYQKICLALKKDCIIGEALDVNDYLKMDTDKQNRNENKKECFKIEK